MKFYASNYLGNWGYTDPFLVDIVDACDPHNDYPLPTLAAIDQPAESFTIT